MSKFWVREAQPRIPQYSNGGDGSGETKGVEMIIVYLLSNHNDKQIYVIYMFLSFFLFLNLCHASLHSPSLLFFEIQKGGAIPITPPPDPPMEEHFHNSTVPNHNADVVVVVDVFLHFRSFIQCKIPTVPDNKCLWFLMYCV